MKTNEETFFPLSRSLLLPSLSHSHCEREKCEEWMAKNKRRVNEARMRECTVKLFYEVERGNGSEEKYKWNEKEKEKKKEREREERAIVCKKETGKQEKFHVSSTITDTVSEEKNKLNESARARERESACDVKWKGTWGTHNRPTVSLIALRFSGFTHLEWSDLSRSTS